MSREGINALPQFSQAKSVGLFCVPICCTTLYHRHFCCIVTASLPTSTTVCSPKSGTRSISPAFCPKALQCLTYSKCLTNVCSLKWLYPFDKVIKSLRGAVWYHLLCLLRKVSREACGTVHTWSNWRNKQTVRKSALNPDSGTSALMNARWNNKIWSKPLTPIWEPVGSFSFSSLQLHLLQDEQFGE